MYYCYKQAGDSSIIIMYLLLSTTRKYVVIIMVPAHYYAYNQSCRTLHFSRINNVHLTKNFMVIKPVFVHVYTLVTIMLLYCVWCAGCQGDSSVSAAERCCSGDPLSTSALRRHTSAGPGLCPASDPGHHTQGQSHVQELYYYTLKKAKSW